MARDGAVSVGVMEQVVLKTKGKTALARWYDGKRIMSIENYKDFGVFSRN